MRRIFRATEAISSCSCILSSPRRMARLKPWRSFRTAKVPSDQMRRFRISSLYRWVPLRWWASSRYAWWIGRFSLRYFAEVERHWGARGQALQSRCLARYILSKSLTEVKDSVFPPGQRNESVSCSYSKSRRLNRLPSSVPDRCSTAGMKVVTPNSASG